MTEKRYTIKPQDDLFGVVDNYSADKICVINGIRTEIEAEWLCKDMNALNDENKQLKSENESYKNMFFEIVETALTDTNCKELYCKGILDIFDKANSLNQAREMIKEHLK